jgi:ABC-type multidrug transport system ATPase subunit
VVVILSTHIVEDVSDLCPRMAILGLGRILKGGRARENSPARSTAGLGRRPSRAPNSRLSAAAMT